jgi:hypothetical protein
VAEWLILGGHQGPCGQKPRSLLSHPKYLGVDIRIRTGQSVKTSVTNRADGERPATRKRTGHPAHDEPPAERDNLPVIQLPSQYYREVETKRTDRGSGIRQGTDEACTRTGSPLHRHSEPRTTCPPNHLSAEAWESTDVIGPMGHTHGELIRRNEHLRTF